MIKYSPGGLFITISFLEEGVYSVGDLIGIRFLLICVKRINRALLITLNIFQKVIYETILIT